MSKKDDASARLAELSVALGRDIQPGGTIAEIEAQIAAAEAELERKQSDNDGDTGGDADGDADGDTGGDADGDTGGDADGDAGAELQIMKGQVQVNPLATFSTKFKGETYLFNKGITSEKIPFELAYSLEAIKKVKILG
ncbi:MAG: hypothetical protein ACI846_000106 [Pseudoalteromonas distincta]|jgi:hypothetical protein